MAVPGYGDLIEAFNIVLTLLLVFFGLRISLSFKKANMNLLKARMFLNRGLVKRMWLYSSLSGALFSAHVLSRLLSYWGYLDIPLLHSLTLATFLVPFVLLTKAWYHLILSSVPKRSEEKGFETSPQGASSERSIPQP